MSQYEFYIVSIAKDEGRYIREWLAYHLGFSPKRVIVYDNESSDDTASIVDSASVHYPVSRILWSVPEGVSPQLSAYNNAINELRKTAGENAWVAFIDLDEFIIETGSLEVSEILKEASQDRNIGAIAINQRVYGDSGLKNFSPEPVLKRFTKCSEPGHIEAEYIKSIYRLDSIEKITDAHGSKLSTGDYVTPSLRSVQFHQGNSRSQVVDFATLQLNHYITKTLDEFQIKKARGGVISETSSKRSQRYDDSFFHNRQALINKMSCPHNERLSRTIDERLSFFDF